MEMVCHHLNRLLLQPKSTQQVDLKQQLAQTNIYVPHSVNYMNNYSSCVFVFDIMRKSIKSAQYWNYLLFINCITNSMTMGLMLMVCIWGLSILLLIQLLLLLLIELLLVLLLIDLPLILLVCKVCWLMKFYITWKNDNTRMYGLLIFCTS